MNDRQLSSKELAKKCRISQASVSRIINADVAVTAPVLVALSNGLGVSVDEILLGTIHIDVNAHKLEQKEEKDVLYAGILSINHKRITAIKNYLGKIIGTSDLAGDLDLAEAPPSVLQTIKQSINEALNGTEYSGVNGKQISLTVVVQSYEFEDTRERFEHLASKNFHSVRILPDWQITYLAAFKKSPGLSVVADKGVSLSYMQNGVLKKLGGWKFPVYDLGGENWLGAQTVQHTIEAFEGFAPMSDLATRVLAKYNGKIEKITETYFKSGRDTDVFCRFADILIRSYFAGEDTAKNIVKQGFAQIDKLVQHADSILGAQYKIALNGSLKDVYEPFFIDSNRLIPSPNDEQKVALLADFIRTENSN